VFNIKVDLNCFELSSDLEVNFLNSRIGGLGIDLTTIQHFMAILKCDMILTLFKYLGMLVGVS